MQRRALRKTTRAPEAINRVGGRPIGVGAHNWPSIYHPELGAKQPMLHVLTIATAGLGVQVPRDVDALALFTSSFEMPLYFDDPTCDYAVLQLTRRDLARGELDGPALPEDPSPAHGLELAPAGGRSPSSNFVGGQPRFIQEDGGAQGFVLQLNDGFVPLNLGDSGELYMYTTWAFWQSH